ncbi:MAG: NTP transferase domain-containing protein, partial [Clostridiales bacterium]|nr:NTP transferase domain-containing protein [Clostridiales bacterium]
MGKTKAIILAAGDSKRMKSQKSKVLHEILGKPIINYVTDAAKNAGADEIIIVAGDNIEALKAHVPHVSFAHQTVRQGTGHAVMCAKEFLKEDDTVIILYGDSPLLQADTVRRILAAHNRISAEATVVSCLVDDPTGYGRIVRENGSFGKIVEQKDAGDEQLRIKEINTGVYCFNGERLLYALSRLTNDNAQNEYYLTDTLEILLNSGSNVQVYLDNDPLDYHGIND